MTADPQDLIGGRFAYRDDRLVPRASWELMAAEPSYPALRVYLPHLAALPVHARHTPVGMYEQLAAQDRVKRHSLVWAPDEADVILFTECNLVEDLLRDWRLRSIVTHELVSRHRERCYVMDQRDLPWCVMPGLYASQPSSSARPRFQAPWCYPMTSLATGTAAASEPDLLFAYIGSPSARCRERVVALEHPRGITERVDGFSVFDPKSSAFSARRERFSELMRRAKFSLCPRGRATSSFRLYETLAHGRVPVIIADDWLAPAGPAWEKFSVRWPERRVQELPAFLESIEHRWREMARAAEEAYREWFAPDVLFDRTIAALSPLVESEAAGCFPPGGFTDRSYLRSGWGMTTGIARSRLVSARDRLRSRH